jgi:hypothetical protein
MKKKFNKRIFYIIVNKRIFKNNFYRVFILEKKKKYY